jgi:phage protein U
MNEYMNERMNKRMNEQINGWVNEGVSVVGSFIYPIQEGGDDSMFF